LVKSEEINPVAKYRTQEKDDQDYLTEV